MVPLFLLVIIAISVSGEKTPLQVDVTKAVTCPEDLKATKSDKVTVHYGGFLMDGTKFDSSFDRLKPFTFELGVGQVIPGWDQGLLGVCTGEERHLVVPADLAYGERGAGEVIPPGATLLFDIVVVSVEKAKSQAAVDAELAAKKAAEEEELKHQQELEAQQKEEEDRLQQEQELAKQEQEAVRVAEAAKVAAEEEKRLQEELRRKQEAEEELKKQQIEQEKKNSAQNKPQPTEEYEYEYVDEAGACEEGELESQVVKASAGRCTRKAQKGDKLSMHYTGRLLDGRKFDSSKDRNKPFDFTLGVGQVIQGWDDGVIGMCVGESRKLTIPPGMAYGAEGVGNVIPSCATLTFEVDLLDIA